MIAQFRSVVLFVQDIAAARHFYEELLGQKVEADFGANVGYVGGLALWDVKTACENVFQRAPEGEARLGRENLEVYFEFDDLDTAHEFLLAQGVKIVHPIMEQPWAQRVLRVYDPDGHVVELGEPMAAMVRRLAAAGLSNEAINERTMMPIRFIEGVLAGAVV
ncbi:MAG TPA: VOC family protein [Phototrophicaceae bacterium]|nr:VOC family protein [Phototrophicaceae bacterium]